MSVLFTPWGEGLVRSWYRRALVEFVKRVSSIARGKAYFTNTMSLGQFVLMDFLRKRTRTVR